MLPLPLQLLGGGLTPALSLQTYLGFDGLGFSLGRASRAAKVDFRSCSEGRLGFSS